MARELVTRRVLARELALNAATKPLNIAVPAAVAVAGLVLGTVLLLVVSVAAYVAMVALTFFDEDEAAVVGERTYARLQVARRPALAAQNLAPEIAEKLGRARAEEARIRAATSDASLPFTGVIHEVERLLRELEIRAERAQRISVYLAEHDDGAVARLEALRATPAPDPNLVSALEETISVREDLRRQLAAFDAQMEHIVLSLGAIHAQIVRASVAAESAADETVAAQVRGLRNDVTGVADALGEAYRRLNE